MKDELFFRSLEIDERKIDAEGRTVSVSFSSETPVRRWFGDEYLLHGQKNVDLSRLRSMGAALLNHKPDFIVGSLKNIKLDAEKKIGRADIAFDDDEIGNRAMKKVFSRSLRGVSVGYRVEKFREVLRDEEFELDDGRKIKGPAMVATRWAPHEISLTPIPADASVGVGRSATRSLDGIEIERTQTQTQEPEMDEKQIRNIVADALKPENLREILAQIQKEDNTPQLRIAADQLSDLLSRAAAVGPDAMREVAKLTGQGKTEAEILRYISDEAIKQAGGPDAGNIPPAGGDGGDQARSLDKYDDDEFARMLTGVSSVPYFD